MFDCEWHLEVICQFITYLTTSCHSGIWSVCQSFKSLFKRVFFDKFGPGFLIPGWKRAFTNHVEPNFGSCHGRGGPFGGRNDRRIQIFWICLHNQRSTQQSYQMCQRKILALSVKNRPSKPNLKPQFIIRTTSNWGHYLWKVTPNLPIYRMYPADLCTKNFNGI